MVKVIVDIMVPPSGSEPVRAVGRGSNARERDQGQVEEAARHGSADRVPGLRMPW
ncbi:hypothetical protein PS9374_01831 [Planomonospora sphaerica]|uniref:Uncharacterized protein n=1 Tax=Planomonospora sphaerica TaxID=161355 RepID=A0A161LK24_9ACTN|nr:hypothetical protein PS9374_01831 [Planomonospora sphaerica]